jgi:hypothetical protein
MFRKNAEKPAVFSAKMENENDYAFTDAEVRARGYKGYRGHYCPVGRS